MCVFCASSRALTGVYAHVQGPCTNVQCESACIRSVYTVGFVSMHMCKGSLDIAHDFVFLGEYTYKKNILGLCDMGLFVCHMCVWENIPSIPGYENKSIMKACIIWD